MDAMKADAMAKRAAKILFDPHVGADTRTIIAREWVRYEYREDALEFAYFIIESNARRNNCEQQLEMWEEEEWTSL